MSGVSTKSKGNEQQSQSNLFAGSDIGYLKGISLASKSFQNLNTVDKLSKKLGINCMCWGKENESAILAGCKGGDIIYHDIETGLSQYVQVDAHQEHYQSNSKAILQEICTVDKQMITAFNDGHIFVNEINFDLPSISTSEVYHLDSLSESTVKEKNLQCMDHNKFHRHMLATGGQENPLRVWDLNNLSSKPIFKAKNVRNDWLSLRVPIWVTKTKFCPNSKSIITGTGHGKVRMYDPNIEQKRPVIEVQCREENPITALEIQPNSDYHVFVGNTLGTLQLIDLRKKAVVKAFKGNKGGVTDIKFHPIYPVFVACSVDRYVRCYDPDKKTNSILHSFYLNSSLNCVLFSSKWKKEDYGDVLQSEKVQSDDEEQDSDDADNSKDLVEDLSENEGDEVWNKLEVVQSKKRKLK